VTLLPPLAVSTGLLAAIQIGPLTILGLLYAHRVRTLAQSGQPVPRRRRGCFYAGLLLIGAAVGALGKASQELLFVHMTEQLLIGDIAALLIVLGLTGPLIAPILKIDALDRLRVLANPLIAFPLWTIDLYLWHLPALYQTALENPWVHALEHAMLLGFGVNMWMCLFGPLPMPGWFGSRGKLLYILAVRLAGAGLGNLLLWSDVVFYPYYLPTDALHHISPLADQNLAGAVMTIEGSLLTIGLLCWLFKRTAREAVERQELLDFALRHNLPLSERRAARAVSAGRGAELRRRLEVRAELEIRTDASGALPPPVRPESALQSDYRRSSLAQTSRPGGDRPAPPERTDQTRAPAHGEPRRSAGTVRYR
jgi:putative membrane protein